MSFEYFGANDIATAMEIKDIVEQPNYYNELMQKYPLKDVNSLEDYCIYMIYYKFAKVMNKRDQMTEEFVSTGMDLETLYACFKDFSKEEIAEIYNNYKENQGNVNNDTDTTGVSINCS